MNPQCKLSDFYYQEPPQLSPDCLEEMALAEQAKDSLKAMKLWEEKYESEIREHRNICLQNISNYAFWASMIGTAKDEYAKNILETYSMKPGFIRSGLVNGVEREYICNYQKSLARVEVKTFREAEKPVYGGAYDR
jgi:hypothetical protein